MNIGECSIWNCTFTPLPPYLARWSIQNICLLIFDCRHQRGDRCGKLKHYKNILIDCTLNVLLTLPMWFTKVLLRTSFRFFCKLYLSLSWEMQAWCDACQGQRGGLLVNMALGSGWVQLQSYVVRSRCSNVVMPCAKGSRSSRRLLVG